ncbi:MAG: HAD family phosphatase [Microbispora sp.]|nr:HAD family phosphatase [Microbispora sp.]
MRFRLVACDLDGTLLNGSGKLTDAVCAALWRAADAGVALAVITARPRRDVDPAVLDRVPASAHWAYSNGALVRRPGTDDVRRLAGIPVAEVSRILSVLRAARPHWSYALDLRDSTALLGAFPEEVARRWNRVVRCASLSHLPVNESPSKILVHTGTVCTGAVVDEVQGLLGDGAVATASGGRFVEIGPPAAGKAAALRWICADLGVRHADVVAVGDGLNDRAMLRLAGLSAAPLNACEEVRRMADLLLPTNDEDAVAVLVDLVLARSPYG